jgi:hypothetical protein
MSTTPNLPHDPLREKLAAAAETLNRKRHTASETANRIAEERNAFFDKLAVLNAGALTFSVTLLNHSVKQSIGTLFLLFLAWMFLLIALGACLGRNLFHQRYRFSDVASRRAESEISFVEADSEFVLNRNIISYADSTEPFDKDREITINKQNSAVWQAELDRHKPKVDRNWRWVVVTEGATHAFLKGPLWCGEPAR